MNAGVRYVHTNLVARDWRQLVRFYVELFDCTPVPPERDLEGDWLAEGTGVPNARIRGMHLLLPGHGENGPTLELFEYDPAEERPAIAPNRPGFGHIAFEVPDVAAVREAVLAAGGSAVGATIRREIPGVGAITFAYLADPEGNIIEVQSWG
jgi:predicted enzyme related to lactoylglutathione lyase